MRIYPTKRNLQKPFGKVRGSIPLEELIRENTNNQTDAVSTGVYKDPGGDIIFSTEVDTDSVNRAIYLISKELLCLQDELNGYVINQILNDYSQDTPIEFDLPFSFIVNSDGGSVLDGLVLYDYLMRIQQSSTITFNLLTCCAGLSASMGAIIFLAGNKRAMTKHSQLMFHSVTGGFYGKYQDAKSQIKTIDIAMEQLEEILVCRTPIGRDKAKELLARDSYISAQEALDLQIIHSIV